MRTPQALNNPAPRPQQYSTQAAKHICHNG
jgi:hypothetical protein